MTKGARDSTLDAIVLSPQIRRSMLERVVRALADAGIARDAQTEAVEGDPAGGEDEFVSLGRFACLLEKAAEQLGDPCLGLRIGLETHPRELRALGFVVLNSPTFGEAAANAQRYLRLHQTHTEVDASRDGGRWRLSYRVSDPTLANLDQDGECTIGILVNGIRVLTGGAFSHAEVHLRRKLPANASEYEALLSGRVRFGQPVHAVLVDEEVMAAEVVGADEVLLPVLEAHARNLIERWPGDDELESELRRLVAESLHSGPPRLDATARRLGMSERTLQRRLDERGLRFHQVVNEIRERLAREYLAKREISLTEVAFLLGYSELSAFGRAFRRWTGQTPRAYRNAAPQA